MAASCSLWPLTGQRGTGERLGRVRGAGGQQAALHAARTGPTGSTASVSSGGPGVSLSLPRLFLREAEGSPREHVSTASEARSRSEKLRPKAWGRGVCFLHLFIIIKLPVGFMKSGEKCCVQWQPGLLPRGNGQSPGKQGWQESLGPLKLFPRGPVPAHLPGSHHDRSLQQFDLSHPRQWSERRMHLCVA